MSQKSQQEIKNKTSSAHPGVVRWALRGLFAKVFVAGLLFLSAGSWAWAWGWVYIGLFVLFDLATALVVMPRHPALLAERAEIQEGTKRWDKVLVRLSAAYLPMISWVVAGLDVRFGWSAPFPILYQYMGLVVVALGYGLVVWSMAANPFFSATVRIQTDRGHTVQKGGPYAIIRHPGYAAAILFQSATPFLLGSWWALIPMLTTVPLYVLRTALEDQTLQEELPGYTEYTGQTRHRLMPGIW
jgi:protein-S-isoprenylcysteine O-methyltransferase Ste14